jgi:hypothetical protein
VGGVDGVARKSPFFFWSFFGKNRKRKKRKKREAKKQGLSPALSRK